MDLVTNNFEQIFCVALLHLILEFIKTYSVHKYIGSGCSADIATELRAGRKRVRIPVRARFSEIVQTVPGHTQLPVE